MTVTYQLVFHVRSETARSEKIKKFLKVEEMNNYNPAIIVYFDTGQKKEYSYNERKVRKSDWELCRNIWLCL